jgi:hypothetical protein
MISVTPLYQRTTNLSMTYFSFKLLTDIVDFLGGGVTNTTLRLMIVKCTPSVCRTPSTNTPTALVIMMPVPYYSRSPRRPESASQRPLGANWSYGPNLGGRVALWLYQHLRYKRILR